MSGGSAETVELTASAGETKLPCVLLPSHAALAAGIGGILMAIVCTVFWVLDYPSASPDAQSRNQLFTIVLAGTGFMLIGGIYLVTAYFNEWLRITGCGFEWHELFRHRKLNWRDVKRAVWVPEKGTARIRFYSATGKLTLFLTQFRRADQPWLMQLIRESVPEDRQEGWERIVAMQARQSGEPVRNGDTGLGIAAALGFIFALILWLAMLGEVPRAWGKFGLMPIIVCPVTFLMSLLDLLRRRASPWLAAALVLSGLGCVFTLMAILHLIRPV
jgi:hypothetical protein